MEFIEWLCLLATAVVFGFFFVFLFWRASFARKPREAMSRGRIVWLLLGGLSVILAGCFVAAVEWHSGEPPRDAVLQAGPLVFVAWGVAEIAIALRAAFARKRAQ